MISGISNLLRSLSIAMVCHIANSLRGNGSARPVVIGGIANLLTGASCSVVIVISRIPNPLRCLTVAIVPCVSYVLTVRTVTIISERSKARLRSNQRKEKCCHLNVFHKKPSALALI